MNQIKVWKGQPFPLAQPSRPRASILRCSPRTRPGWIFACSTTLPPPRRRCGFGCLSIRTWSGIVFCPTHRGQLYGYRVQGPFEPENGHRFNEAKLLLDPYAKAITGLITWSTEMFGYPQDGSADADLERDTRDDAWGMPKSVAVADEFDWEGDKLLGIPLAESVIYEVHVKGFSKLCPDIPEAMRGRYAGIGSDFAIQYFKKLGITAVELLPVHHFLNDQFLEDKGLANYWGYNSLGYFAPHSEYSGSGVVGEQVRGVQGDGEAPARGGNRGDPRRGL